MNGDISPISPDETAAASKLSIQPGMIRFDRYVLDLRRGTLRSGVDEIEIRPKTFEVLKLLVENAGRLVSKDEIVAAVWPDVVVTDDSLVQCVKELRRAFGEDGNRLVRTVPRRGYRLEASALLDITVSPPDAIKQCSDDQPLSATSATPRRPHRSVGPRWRPWLAAAVCVLALVAIGFWISGHAGPDMLVQRVLPRLGKPAIAVLPFASPIGNGDYFAEGMTDDVINALGRFSSLTVMSRNAVAPFKVRSVTPQQIGRDLSVQYLLEGSVRRLGGQLRVTAELIDADRGEVLWSGRFEGSLRDVFAVQDRITTQVVGGLAVKVTQVEQQRAFAKPTESLEAYDYVLRARRAISEAKRSTNVDARALLKKAIELDPRYAAAYTGLGETYRIAVAMGWAESPGAAVKEADVLAHKALSLSDSEARAHVLLGQLHIYYGRYEQALVELDRASAINSNDVDAVSGRGAVLVWSGRTEEGITALEMAQRIDPALNNFNRFALALAYYLDGRYDPAVELLARNLSETPEASYNRAVLAASYAQQGRSEEAARAAEELRRSDPAFDADAFGTQLQKPTDRERLRVGLRRAGF
jgi:TolB-like protein/DNA-binding winged helix-turn-helix (wHTH) protein/cytochrome c-type biogenesis protein CcmH/NrfG